MLDLVGPKDAARAARTCRDFAETVRAWRANKKHLAPPAALTVTGVCSLIRAYPNLESVSLRRCARGRLRYSASDVFRVLRAAASGPAARTLRSVDLEGCDVADADVVALLETFATPSGPEGAARHPISELKLGKCARVTDKALAALAAHRRARTAVGIRRRHGGHRGGREGRPRGRGAGGLPLLERFDFSGCLDAKGALALPPLMTAKALRAAYLPALTALTAQLPKHAGLASLHVSQCVNLTSLHVSAASLLRLNASQCTRLSRLELHCASLQVLHLQHCAALTGPLAFTCRGLTEELNVSGCVSLHAESLRAMVAGAPVAAPRMEGCASLEGELAFASRALREVIADGCGRLESLRVARRSCVSPLAGART